MTRYRFLNTGALAALMIGLIATALPAQAQERENRRGEWSQRGNAERAERRAGGQRGEWRQQRQDQGREQDRRFDRSSARAQAEARAQAARNYGADRRGSYGATTRSERREDARESRQDYRQGYRAGQREDWRDDREDRQRAYARGYRAGDRSDDWRGGHYGRDNDRWDRRGWRSDNRYDWYRYRAANRSLFSPGRYYAPYRGYSYSRLGIGIRLGSPFYSNRYWINDPWRYRLPSAYGPYRWIRYYDDAVLVNVYSGEVADVIHNFFW